MEKAYIIIDLKSFFASVECVERGLDPFKVNLVVADPEREKGTICLAITPAMKAQGVKNRCRVYEIPPNVDYIMAPPRMQLYIDYSAAIYAIYLKYIAAEDIHVYSVDEAFMDVSKYLSLYRKSAREIGMMIMADIRETTGITATCGVGTNLFLAKVALDIVSKHSPDFIGELTEESFRATLWHHKPLTDFWKIGHGTERRLASVGLLTLEDVAKADEAMLYRLFGVDAELLIDHAWGRESATMEDIKAYRPKTHSVSNGQVLLRDYNYQEAELIVKEMSEQLCLEMVKRRVVADSFSLYVSYSHLFAYPPAGGTTETYTQTSSAKMVRPKMVELYRRITNPMIPVRRINVSANHTMDEAFIQYDLFVTPDEVDRERSLQRMVLAIRQRFGNNAILKGMNLEEAGTTIARNVQIGGHKSWG